ncbi:MAG: hypothetical protein EOP04_32890 [Proteobacteria bacterium]|nr:MAG: hypothetical protein EOP04_32890 [Pseudomonadota bacterium]
MFINGAFNKSYHVAKDLFNSDCGHILYAKTGMFGDSLNLEDPIPDTTRAYMCDELFRKVIVPFSTLALSKSGLKKLADEGEIHLFPAVAKELERLTIT